MMSQNRNNTKLNPNLIRIKSLYNVIVPKSYEHSLSYLEDQNYKTYIPSDPPVKIYCNGYRYASVPIVI